MKFILFFFLFIVPPAWASSGTSLTMHGPAAMAPGWAHYPYVNPDAPKGGTLKQAAIGSFDTLNPFTLKGKPPLGLGPGPSLVYDRLTDRSWDEPFTLYPLIAETWDVAPDRSSITFTLNAKARFHDGTPITSQDVEFSWKTLRDFGRPNMRRVYQLVKTVTVVNDRTIRFDLGPGHDRETVMILAMMPVLSRAYYQTHSFDTASLAKGLGSGPYRVESAEPGRRIVYARVKDYWAADLPTRKGLFNFDQIIFDYFRDESIAFEAFKAGNLNFRRENDVTQWARSYDFPRRANGIVTVETLPHGRAETVRAFMMNTRRPPFDDVRVRQALGLAMEFYWINRNLYAGMLTRTTNFFPNTDLITGPDDTASLDRRAALRQADGLLRQAGWIVKNGIRVQDQTGKPLQFEILLGAPGDEKIALAYVRSLKPLGITARVRTMDSAAFRDRLNNFSYDMILYFIQSTLSPGGEQALYWGCAAADQPGRFNYARLCTPELDRLSAAIAEARTRDELRTLTTKLNAALWAQHAFIPLGYLPHDLVAYDKGLARPTTTPLYGMVIEAWWAKPVAETPKP